jgi:hypothetical protein
VLNARSKYLLRLVAEQKQIAPPGRTLTDVRIFERVLRIAVASALTIIFTAWSVHLFESQPSEAPKLQLPKCPTNPPDQACIEHSLRVAFSGNLLDGRWSLWVVWTFWALIAVVWLAACALILWAPHRTRHEVGGE